MSINRDGARHVVMGGSSIRLSSIRCGVASVERKWAAQDFKELRQCSLRAIKVIDAEAETELTLIEPRP